jgi:hypothetical protein
VFLTLITVGLALYIDNRKDLLPAISGRRMYGEQGGFSRKGARNLVAEFAIYVLLTGVSACRIAVGNDYWVYRDNFKLIAQERHVSSEVGFNFIVRCMIDFFGYDNYLPIFALFSVVTVFFFVAALHYLGEYYAFSLFLLLTGGYYFHSLNSIRYYLALAIALFSMKYVLNAQFGKFVLLIAIGSLFHKSVLLVIPVYLAGRFLAVVKLKPWYYAVGGIFLIRLVFGQDFYRAIIFKFYPYYEGSVFDNGQISYVNIGKCLATLVLCLVCYKKVLQNNLAYKFYFYLNLFGLVAYCCGSFVPEISRVGYYMIVSQVFLLPGVVKNMGKGWFRTLCTIGVIGAFSLYFVLLLRDMYATDVRLLPYLNWIFN